MTRSAFALACVAALCAGSASTASANAAECSPSATVAGDAAVAVTVSEHLGRMGVSTEPIAEGCPRVEAEVTSGDDGVRVTLRDAAGRVEERVVSDAYIAATWIQSWCRPDIGAPLLAVRAAPAAPPSATPAPPAVRDRPEVDAEVDGGRGRRGVPVWGGLSVATERADDDRRALSVTADACVEVGGFCLGGLARFARQADITANDGLTHANRTNLALLATASYPIALGRTRLSPSIGAGVGRTHTGRDNPSWEQCISDPMPNPDGSIDPADPNGDPETFPCDENPPFRIDDGFSVTAWDPRVEARVVWSIPLARFLWLDLGVSASLAPGAHTGAHRPDYAEPPPPPDPTFPEPESDPLFDLPGERRAVVRAGLGLRFGVR